MWCVDKGADATCLGSTTMHQAHAHLVEDLPVHVINPGPLSYKIAQAAIDLGLTQNRAAYNKPIVPKTDFVHAMLERAPGIEGSFTRPAGLDQPKPIPTVATSWSGCRMSAFRYSARRLSRVGVSDPDPKLLRAHMPTGYPRETMSLPQLGALLDRGVSR
jgi:hypothetical protein